MTHVFPKSRTITIMVDGRRFRAILDRCDDCGAEMTISDLQGVAVAMGEAATDDNLVFSCSTCFVKGQTEGEKVIDYLHEIVSQAILAAADDVHQAAPGN